jgi:hypothetical protein
MKMNHISLVRRACAPALVCSTLLLFASSLQADGGQKKDASEADVAQIDQVEFFPSPLEAEFNHPTSTIRPPSLMLVPLDNPALIAREDERNVLRYEHTLSELEHKHGALAPELYETLTSLALLQQKRGEHEVALELLDRAAHIDKANNGLYTEEQITLARHTLTSLRALGDRAAIQNQLERLVVLSQRHYGRDGVETALAMKQLGEWQLEDFLHRLKNQESINTQSAQLNLQDPLDRYARDSEYLKPLYAAQKTFIDAIDVIVKKGDFANPGLFELENDLIETYYINAKRDLVLRDPDYLHRIPRRDVSSIQRVQRAGLLPQDYQYGVTAYQRQLSYLQRNPKATVGELSQVMLALADWHLLFGQYEEANKQRATLSRWLSQAGLNENQIERLTLKDSPVVLPTFVRSPLSPREFDPDAARGHIDLALHITPWGSVSDVELLGMSEGTPEPVVKQLLSMVKSARFRSDSDDGSTNGIRYYYDY